MIEKVQVASLDLDSLESLFKILRRPDLNTQTVYSENILPQCDKTLTSKAASYPELHGKDSEPAQEIEI